MIKSESYKRGVVTSTVLNVFAKGIGFFNTLIIAFYFGANAGTDIYFYILSVAILISGTINGIDYFVLVPESMKIREQKNDREAQIFFNFFIYAYAAIGLLLALAGTLAPTFFYTLFSKYDIHVLNSNLKLLYLGIVIIVFQLINNLLTAILTSYKFFTASILSGLINSVFAILFTLVFHEKLGITGTLLGIALGYLVNFFILIFLLKKYQKWNFSSVRFLRDKRVWKNMGLMQVNILPVWIRSYFTIYFLTGMGAGIITSFSLAQMLAGLPEIFILTQVASVAGIKFSELAAKDDVEETNSLLINLLNSLFVIIIPIALVMAIANKDVIQIVFERGNFQKDSIGTTAFCFFFFSLLLPSKIFDVLFSRLFTSFQLYGISTIFAIIVHTIITALLYVLTTYFNLQGFFISLLIGYYILLPVTVLMITKRKIPGIRMKAIFKDAFLLLVAATGIYFFASYLFEMMDFNSFIKIFILFFIVFLPFFVLANLLVDLKYQKKIIINLFAKKIHVKTE